MKRSKMSRALAVFLAIVMCFTMTTTISFADHNTSTGTTKNVLVFGASTSSGYGLADFYNSNAGFAVDNNDLTTWTYEKATSPENTQGDDRGRISETSYPWQLKQYIQRTEGVDVDLSAMCLNGMRSNELHALLDEDYYEAVYQWELETSTPDYSHGGASEDIGFLTNHIRSFTAHLGRGGAKVDGVKVDNNGGWSAAGFPGGDSYKRAVAYTKAEIANADVIVVDVCMNNFGTYMAERIAGKHNVPGKEYAMNYYKQNAEDNPGVSPKTLELMNKLKKTLKLLMPVLNNDNANEFLDSFTYCYADCITNFSADIELIREINPDAKIIAVGVYNTLDGINLVLDGQTLDFGDIAAKGFDLVNGYIKAMDKNSNNYYYADVSGGIETFMNQIRNAEDFDSLMADDSGNSLMENMYSDFMKSYGLTGMFNDDPEVNYNGIKNTLEDMFSNAGNKTLAMKDWDKLGDEEVVAAKGYVVDYNGNKGVVPEENQTGVTYLTKALLLQMCGGDEATASSQYQDLKAGVENMYTQGDILAAMKNWADLESDELFTVTTYVICTGNKDQPYYVTPSAGDTNKVYLTKGKVPCKENIQKLLYNAGTITDIHLDELMENLKNMKSVEDELQAYILQGITPSTATMELLHIVDRFILYQGVGQHPSKKGCEAMTEDVLLAYDKAQNGGNTAFEDAKADITAMLDDLLEMLRGSGAGEDIDEIIAKINQVQAILEIVDEEGLTPEQLEELFQMKRDLEARINETLDALGITMDELIESLNEATTPEKIAEYMDKFQKISALLAIIDEEGLTAEQLQELFQMKRDLEAYMNEVLDALGITMDDVIAEAQQIKNAVDLQKVAQTIKWIKEAIKKMPTSREELVALLQEKLDEAQKILEEKAAGILSDDIMAQIREINQKLKKAIDENDFSEIIEELMPIGAKLLKIGEAVAGLPEYQDAMDAYVESSNIAIAGLEGRVSALEAQIDKLTAKSIDVDLYSDLTFPQNTVTINVVWEIDEDAAGYKLMVNGEEADFEESEDGVLISYALENAQIGEVYQFEVTPYVISSDGKFVYGKTFQQTVVPQVTLKKVALKKVKPAKKAFTAKWKAVANADGYQIYYKAKGTKAKYKNVADPAKLSQKVKKLKSKKYTVKVRAYQTLYDTPYYGAWSKAKKVKVK